MIKIILSGSSGRMGQAIVNSVKDSDEFQIAFGIQRKHLKKIDFNVYKDIFEAKENGDVIVDYSTPQCLNNLLNYAVTRKLPIILATTGYSEEELEEIGMASKKIPVFCSANMSLGITGLLKAISALSHTLSSGYEIEIIEKHHNKKVDSPSGTAKLLRDRIYSSFGINTEIKIHSLRSGTNPGEHSIIFSGKDEIIELKHSSYSQELFALGTLKAIKFIQDKPPGLYSMEDL